MSIKRLKNVNSFQGSDENSGKSDRVSVFKEFIKSEPCLSALFVTDVCIDSQLLKFHTRN